MKRIVTTASVIAVLAAAPSVASAANVVAEKPQLTVQVANVQVANVQRANVAALKVQRHLVQIAQAKRFSLLRAQIR